MALANFSSMLGYDPNDPNKVNLLNQQGLLYQQQKPPVPLPGLPTQQPNITPQVQQQKQGGTDTTEPKPQISQQPTVQPKPPTPPPPSIQSPTVQQKPATPSVQPPVQQPQAQGPGKPAIQQPPPQQQQPQAQGGQQSYSQFQPQQIADQLTQFLNNRFFNYQGPQGFQAPQFQPGQNPFVPNFQPNPVMQQAGQFASNTLNTPSRYDTQLAKDTYNQFNQQLQTQFDAAKRGVNEDASARGLYYSSIPQGQEGDLAIKQAQAQAQKQTDILRDQAQTLAQDRATALQGALGYGQEQFGQQLGQFQAGLQGQGQQFGQALQGYGANLQGQQQGFTQQQQALQDLLGFGQQQYQNQLSTAQFNQNQDSLNNQLMAMLLGAS